MNLRCHVHGHVHGHPLSLKQAHQDQRHACLQENLQGSLTLRRFCLLLLLTVGLKQQDVGGKQFGLGDLQQLLANLSKTSMQDMHP